MQFIPLMADVESSIVECFRTGGGVPYAQYEDIHRLMAEESAGVHDAALVETIIPLVDGLPDRLRDGIDVADIGCGSPFLYTISTMHCMTVSLSLDGAGLGAAWGEQKAQQMPADAGLSSVDTTHVDADILNTYYIARTNAH